MKNKSLLNIKYEFGFKKYLLKLFTILSIMGGGNLDLWHDCMYVHCTLVTT